MKIKINGNEYSLHWGMGALRLFCESTGYEFEKGVEIVAGLGEYSVLERTKAVVTMILCAAKNYANINGLDISNLNFYQVEAYRDATPREEFQKVMDDFTNSMLNGKTMAETLGFTVNAPIVEKKSVKASTKKLSSSTK